ncbi:putative deoxyribonuclease TATDN2 [Caerostris extrusa]|uniref:Deoxyribonuclease TATDN2 n=1 Tax=Caerostris extrusa TaxID=172846 RepID=A0AAV4YC68_CAEEX|nr:putative deoxyribonuclease TATDN2 [Caerostris extrusa]
MSYSKSMPLKSPNDTTEVNDTQLSSATSPKHLLSEDHETYESLFAKHHEIPLSVINQIPKFHDQCYDFISNFINFKNHDHSNYERNLAMLKFQENDQFPSPITKQTEAQSCKYEDQPYKNIPHTQSAKHHTSLIKSSSGLSLIASYENDTHQDDSFSTPVRDLNKLKDKTERYVWESPEYRNSSRSRGSLPARTETAVKSSEDISNLLNKRQSFPFTRSQCRSPVLKRNFSTCIADQTPYPKDDSYQKRKRIRSNLPYYNAIEVMSLESKCGFIDTHCHLDFLFQRQGYEGSYAEYQKEHHSTFPKSYKGCLAIFCNPFTFSKRQLWEKYLKEDDVWASFGCHPHNAKDYNDSVERALYEALEHSKVRALGEIGLDYSNRNKCMKDLQFEAFRRQLKIALKKKLPVVIHCREAHDDGMKIINEILPKDYTIHLHCFTDTWENAKNWLDEFPNLFIGITNVVTFPSAESVHEVAQKIPLDRLLLETDAPYFVPRAGQLLRKQSGLTRAWLYM